MQIGLIGASKIGSTVGRLWAKAGHKVRFATRHPDEPRELARELGPEIEGKVVADAGNLYPAGDGKMAEEAIKAGGSGVWVELWQGRGPRKSTDEKIL